MLEKCSNCGASFKAKMFGEIYRELNAVELKLIVSSGGEKISYCSKCGAEALKKGKAWLEREKQAMPDKLEVVAKKLPILTFGLAKFEYVGTASSVAVVGTGFLSELSSAFNDAFGTRSTAMQRKLQDAEMNCKMELAAQAIEAGGNAIIGATIGIEEFGSKSMLCVRMSGTVVKLDLETMAQMGVKNEDALNSFLAHSEMIEEFRSI